MGDCEAGEDGLVFCGKGDEVAEGFFGDCLWGAEEGRKGWWLDFG